MLKAVLCQNCLGRQANAPSRVAATMGIIPTQPSLDETRKPAREDVESNIQPQKKIATATNTAEIKKKKVKKGSEVSLLA